MKLLNITLLFAFFTLLLNAQITINSADWQAIHTVGNEAESYTTPMDSIFIGEASSSPQYWDFSTLTFTKQSEGKYIDPATAPHYSFFPGANSVFMATTDLGGQPIITYNYDFIDANNLVSLGVGSDLSTPDVIYSPMSIIVDFPLTYGSVVTSIFETSYVGLTAITDTITKTVDGFGTIKLPHGEFPALRVLVKSANSNVMIQFYTKGTENVGIQFAPTTDQLNTTVAGVAYYSKPINTTAVNDDEMLNSDYSLSQNYPNPFNPSTTIHYSIPTQSEVSLKVYNLLGKEVAELVNESKAAGKYNVQFDGSNLTSGVYFYKISAGNFTETKKLMLVK